MYYYRILISLYILFADIQYISHASPRKMGYGHIAILFLIFFMMNYLVYRWFLKKTNREVKGTVEGTTEGFDTIAYPGKDAFADTKNLPLKEYAIKASYNSAYDGKNISLEQLSNVMYYGCRFIDLNVFVVDSSSLYVGFSSDNAPTMVDVSLPFHQAIDYINAFAFQIDREAQNRIQAKDYSAMVRKSLAPENQSQKRIQDTYTEYPLFLNIRVYRPPSSNIDVVSAIHTEVKKLKKQYLNPETGSAMKVSQYTRLSELMGKVVVVMDIENILEVYTSPAPYDPEKIPAATRDAIDRMVNIKTGGHNWGTFYRYSDIVKNPTTPLKKLSDDISKVSYETNTLTMKLVYPSYSEKTDIPDALDFLKNYQIQCVPMRYYLSGANLDKYNRMFDSNKTPMLPLYNAHTYLSNSKTQK